MKKYCNYRIVPAIILMMLLCVLSVSGCGKSSSKALSEYWASDTEAAESLRDMPMVMNLCLPEVSYKKILMPIRQSGLKEK